MNILASIKISNKILFLLLMLGAVTLTVAVIGSSNLLATNAAYSAMVNGAKAPLYAARANRRVVEMGYAAYRTIAWPGTSKQAAAAALDEQTAYDAGKASLAQAISAYPSQSGALSGYLKSLDEAHILTKRATELGLADKNAEATAVLEQADGLLSRLGRAMAATNDQIIAANDAASNELTVESNSRSFWMLTLSIAGIVVSIGVGLLVSRIGITVPLVRLKDTMQKLAGGHNDLGVEGADRSDELGDMAKVVLVFRETAVAKAAADADKASADATLQMVVQTLGSSLSELSNRDLTSRVTAEYPGAYSVLKTNFNEALDNVQTAMRQVNESVINIRTGSSEIAQASEDLARRTEGNAASLEETSAALVQIDGRLKATAVAAGRTVERADQAISTVGIGRATAEEAVAAMERVSGSAKGIASVIEGVDKIAFQTRVLAMNAAVEAGRAGDAGRGFAVVADLVSALAMRAEEEAKRARDQLTVTQTDIVTAVEAVQKVDGALANISGDVGEVHELLGSMASDNQAQSSTITQITAAIGAMDHSTQQNAAMVEETSAAARNLTTEVGSLAEQAALFKVDAGEAKPRSVAAMLPAAPAPTRAKKAASPAVYRSPVKPLPVAAIANGASSDDWKDF